MPARKRVPYEHIETTQESLQVLASYRVRGVRNSQDVVNRGEKILQEKGALGRMGDEGTCGTSYVVVVALPVVLLLQSSFFLLLLDDTASLITCLYP